MATSEEIRQAYADIIVQWPTLENNCTVISDESLLAPVGFPTTLTGSGRIQLKVHRATVRGWEAFSDVLFSHGATLDNWAGGTFNPRVIAGTCRASLHALGCAIDWFPVIDPTSTLAADLNALGAFRQLSGDLMHWQIDLSPAQLAGRFGFWDVPSNHWAYGQIEAARLAGLVAGHDDGSFRPADPITRAQMVIMFNRIGFP